MSLVGAARPYARAACVALLVALVVLAISLRATRQSASLPPGFPRPLVPADNPVTPEKVALGRYLFYDVRLSANGTQSCASCHRQARAFSDDARVSRGSTGDATPRNSMSLTNVAYASPLTWSNPALTTLEAQALVPIFGEHPVELGLAGNESIALSRLRASADDRARFRDAFPDDAEPVTIPNVVRALASFERKLISGRSPYDRFVHDGEAGALTLAAQRGRDLFFGEKLDCFHCHGGFNFSDATAHDGKVLAEGGFHDNGLERVAGDPERGFRAPTLRNIELTAPYMHDGRLPTLEAVLDHYARGGTGDGIDRPAKSIFVHGFTLTDEERADVIAFLRSLTDRAFVEDPRLSDPFVLPHGSGTAPAALSLAP